VKGDFNGDGFDDLAIGVPGEDVVTAAGTIPTAGAVNVIYGSSSGLSATTPRPDQFLVQGNAGVDDARKIVISSDSHWVKTKTPFISSSNYTHNSSF
jgi:FG-GAP repeat